MQPSSLIPQYKVSILTNSYYNQAENYNDDVFSVNIDELIYITFIENKIIHTKDKFNFLGSSEQMEKDFKNWLKEKNLRIVTLEMDDLITSLWSKSLRYIESFILEYSPEHLPNEIERQNTAAVIKFTYFDQYTGKIFTPRQLDLLFAALKASRKLANSLNV